MKTTIIAIMVLGLMLAGCAVTFHTPKPVPAEPKQFPPEQGGQPPRLCTMEYMPVCGVDGKTYGNKCSAGDVAIAYQGECNNTAPAKMPPLNPEMCADGSCPKEPVATEPSPQLVGNDRDAHGCIPSAGYSWCEAKQKCLRVWEEPC